MIDARMANNLLLVLRPEIERAQATLEAAKGLQDIIAAAAAPAAPEPSDVAGKTVGEYLREVSDQAAAAE
jgi:hypothetical protein